MILDWWRFVELQVLDAGRVKEFDAPYILLKNAKSIFSQLVTQTGNDEARKLYEIAREAYYEKQSLKEDNEFEEAEQPAKDGFESLFEAGNINNEVVINVVKPTDNISEEDEVVTKENENKLQEADGTQEDTEKKKVIPDSREGESNDNNKEMDSLPKDEAIDPGNEASVAVNDGHDEQEKLLAQEELTNSKRNGSEESEK